MLSRTRPLLACLLICGLSACGGGQARTQLAHGVQPGVTRAIPALSPTPSDPALIPQLPPVPQPERLVMPRITASIDATALASEYTSHGGDVTPNGTQALFDSTPQHVSWAIYSFGGVPSELISKLSYVVTGNNPGETVYVAISDYVAKRWLFLPVQSGSVVSIDLPSSTPGAYQSALGNTSVLFAVFGGDNYELANLSLTYAARHTVTGSVIDKTGGPVADVVIRTPMGSLSTITDAAGHYSLAGVPDGSWPILATKDGWTFYPTPQTVSVAGADSVAGDLLGDPHGAHFTATDLLPGNNTLVGAPTWDFAAGPLNETLSADSDYLDTYKFTIQTAGRYLMRFSNPDRNILAPKVAVFGGDVVDGINYAEDIYAGEVAVELTVTQVPQSYRVLAAATGGGGKYSLTLTQGAVGRLGLYMNNGAGQRVRGIFQVLRSDDGLQTDYFTLSPINSGGQLSVYDRSYPVGDIVVTPVLPNHTFTPASSPYTVTDAPSVTGGVFSFSAQMVSDSYEPNDDFASAHSVSLPYNSPDPLQVTTIPGPDLTDVFMVTPPAGVALRANVLYNTTPTEAFNYPRIVARITNNVGTEVMGRTYFLPTGIAVESVELTDGNPYYVFVEGGYNYPLDDDETINYALQINSYAAKTFRIGARVGGLNKVDGMRFLVYDQDFAARYSVDNQTADQLTPVRLVPTGTQLRVDCQRLGTPFDGLTQLVTVNADTTLYLDAPSLGPDSREPNGTVATANQLGFLPADINATYNNFDDDSDYYSLVPGDGRPFKLELTGGVAGRGFSVAMFDSLGNPVGRQVMNGPAATIYFPNDGLPGQYFDIGTYSDYSFPYSLHVSNSDAFKVSGVVKSAALTGLDGVVVNETTGARATSSAGSGGSFAFDDELGPGTYTLACYAAGYGPPLAEKVINVTTTDITNADFLAFLPTVDDNFEPNDSTGTAALLMLNSDYSASVTTADSDYYRITLSRGDQIRLTLTPENQWEQADVTLFDQYSSGSYEDIVSATGPAGIRQIEYTAAGNVSYVMKVESNDACRYKLRVQKMN